MEEEARVEGMRMEHVSEYLRYFLYESRKYDAECCRGVETKRKVAGDIMSMVNDARRMGYDGSNERTTYRVDWRMNT